MMMGMMGKLERTKHSELKPCDRKRCNQGTITKLRSGSENKGRGYYHKAERTRFEIKNPGYEYNSRDMS